MADILSPNEFNILSYYHISRFISKVLQIDNSDTEQSVMKDNEDMTLRKFVYDALDLNYEQTEYSRTEILKQQNLMKKDRSQSLHQDSTEA